jgi:hypothetical protein
MQDLIPGSELFLDLLGELSGAGIEADDRCRRVGRASMAATQ